MTTSIDQLKNQLRQLKELAQSGALPDDQAQAAKARLERQLLDAVMAGGTETAPGSAPAGMDQAVTEPPQRVSRKLMWGMLAFVVAVGAGGYAWVGNPDGWHVGPGTAPGSSASTGSADESANASGTAPHTMSADQINAMVDGLAAKLKADPNNADGWTMLARTYAALNRFEESLPAYKKAIALRPDDASLYADLADALAVTQGRQLAGEPTRLVTKALSLDPNNFKALSLMGTVAYDKQDFKTAASLWERAVQHAPADNPELTRQVQSALDDARQKAGLPALAPQPAEASVSGTVTLSKALLGKASPDDTVFIFAKAAQGPKMPLAILRKQVKDLPVSFDLTDAMAMSPQTKLSGFSEVIVGARISKSGQAMPQPGDWEGHSAPVKVGTKAIQIEIADEIR